VEDITAMAERLGRAIAGSPQAAALREAQKALEAETETTQLLREYQEQARRIGQLEADEKPVEPEDKRKLDELHAKLVATATFKKLTAAQVEYVDVMRQVNDAIRKHLNETEG